MIESNAATTEPPVPTLVNLAQDVFDTVREPLLVLDAGLYVRAGHAPLYGTFKRSPGRTSPCESRAGRLRQRPRTAPRARCRALRTGGERRLLRNVQSLAGRDRAPPGIRARRRAMGTAVPAHAARGDHSEQRRLQRLRLGA